MLTIDLVEMIPAKLRRFRKLSSSGPESSEAVGPLQLAAPVGFEEGVHIRELLSVFALCFDRLLNLLEARKPLVDIPAQPFRLASAFLAVNQIRELVIIPPEFPQDR